MKLFYTFICFSLFLSIEAQVKTHYSTKNPVSISHFEEAKGLILNKKPQAGLAILDELLKTETKFYEAFMLQANVYYQMQDFVNAAKSYERVTQLRKDGNMYLEACMKAGEIYFSEGKYAKAKDFFVQFLAANSEDDVSNAIADLKLKSCDFAFESMKNPLPFEPKLLPKEINSMDAQYFPSITADMSQLVFVGVRDLNKDKDEDIYIAEYSYKKWNLAKPISNKINTKENEGTCTISGDGRTIVFTACGRKDSYGSCDLYVSHKQGNIWSFPKNMGPQINTANWESQPTLTTDGRKMYFASSRRTGWGKEDIYVSQMKEDGTWTEAQNLGKPINTKGSDKAPYLHINGQSLFFSSDGHIGMGDFDLYKSELDLDSNKWSEPYNLGYPLNTANAEMALVIAPNDKKGYFSTESSHGGHTKLYEFELMDRIKPKNQATYFKGVVYDEVTKQPISANIDVIDLKTNETVSRLLSDSLDGSYLVSLTEGREYAIYASKANYMFKSLSFNFKNKQSFDPQTLDIYLHPIELGAKIVLNNLYFESGKYDLQPKSITEFEKLVKFMKTNWTAKVEISGHTDDVGSDVNNLKLSVNRAKVVYEQLIKMKTTAERLKFQGYGETQPSLPNTTPENRAINRRIELKIISIK